MTEPMIPRHAYPAGAAAVTGVAARALWGFILHYSDEWDSWRSRYPEPGMEITSVMLALEWAASVDASATLPEAEVVAGSVAMNTISVTEYARTHKVSTSWVRQMLRDDKLDGELVGGRWVIRMEGT